MRECEWCGKSIVSKNAQARFCSSKHRVYAHRAARVAPAFPAELRERNRWVRWAEVMRKGRLDKVPLQLNGANASSTDPKTWSSYDDASASTLGAGLGFVLGDGIGCIDLDHCLIDGRATPEARKFLRDYPSHYIEVSPSGDGLHIWGLQEEQGGRRQSIGGLSVERYSVGRYITMTGNVYQPGELLPL
tara:strand:+ start:20679 stop:21245 length:567 start_codon:yes stop_codon:yes gene_type:complete